MRVANRTRNVWLGTESASRAPAGRDRHDARQGHRMGSVLRETAHDHEKRDHDDPAPHAKKPCKQATGGADAQQDERLFA
jgi:hypothetical protein